jgi:hypothetical protein
MLSYCLSGSNVFFHIMSKWYDIWQKKLIEHKNVFWFALQLLSETVLLLEKFKKILWNINIGFHLKRNSLFFSDFNKAWNFSIDFLRIHKSNFMKTCPVGADLFHVDGQADMMKVILIFHTSAHVLTNLKCVWHCSMTWSTYVRQQNTYSYEK